LALTNFPVKAQMKAYATGSVVDALSETDLNNVIIPYPNDKELCEELGIKALKAWHNFSKATQIENNAIDIFEKELRIDGI